jgi:quercetin dioxygenase-like cupin family protein
MAAPGEREMRAMLRREGLEGHAWSNRPNDRYRGHSHDYTKVLYCLTGSIAFQVEGTSVELNPGDRLEIDPGTVHAADVGPHGVVCLEAARPPR